MADYVRTDDNAGGDIGTDTGGEVIPVTDGNDENTGGGDGGNADPETVPDDGGGFEIPMDPVDEDPVIKIDDLVAQGS